MYSNLFFVNRYAMRTERLCYFSWLGHWVGLVTFCINFMGKYGNGGWCRDESAYLTPLWLGFHSQTWNHIMLVRILAPRFFFFIWFSCFPPPTNSTLQMPKSLGILEIACGWGLYWFPLLFLGFFFSQLSISHFILIWKTVDKEPPDRIAAAKWNQFSFLLSGSLKLHLMNLNYMPDLRSNGV